MSITESVGGFFIHFERQGIVMRQRKRTRKEAEICLKMMQEEQIVEMNRVRYIFHPDRIYIIRKPKHSDPKYKCPFEQELYQS
jgi:hypothetical protein